MIYHMKFIYLACIALLLLLSGCYDDKGNYDYNPLNRIEIESFNVPKTYYLGDKIEIKPVLNFAIDSIEDHLLLNGLYLATKNLFT